MPRDQTAVLARAARDTAQKRVSRAVDDCILAAPSLTRWLQANHPPFETDMRAALKHYGGKPCANFDLWLSCRALDRLCRAVEAREVLNKKPRTPVQG